MPEQVARSQFAGSAELEPGMVSVITPSYNAERFIGQTAKCVLTQSFKNLELIVSDDASTDGTVEILNGLAESEPRLRVVANERNRGAAITRNRALALARGQYVAFLDADDIWLPCKLERQLSFMRERGVAFCFTAYEICNEGGEPSGQVVDMACPDEIRYTDMLAKRATLGCSTVMIDQSRAGPLQMPMIRTGQDYALWLKLLKAGWTAYRLPEVLTRYRIVAGSISRNKFRKAARQWQIYRELEGLPLLPAAWYFANYAYRAVRRV